MGTCLDPRHQGGVQRRRARPGRLRRGGRTDRRAARLVTDDRLRHRRRPDGPAARTARQRRAATLRKRHTPGRAGRVSHRQRVSRVLGHRRGARCGRRHRHHRSRHRRRPGLWSGRLAPRLETRRLRQTGGRRGRRPRDRVQRPGHRRQLLVPRRGTRRPRHAAGAVRVSVGRDRLGRNGGHRQARRHRRRGLGRHRYLAAALRDRRAALCRPPTSPRGSTPSRSSRSPPDRVRIRASRENRRRTGSRSR